jgi:hypothetical protein
MGNTGIEPVFKAFFVAVFCTVLTMGCGYRVNDSRSPGKTTGMDIDGLALSLVESPSSSLGFEAEFTRTLRKEFISFSRVPLMHERDAPYVLECSVQDISTEPRRHSPTRTVFQGEEHVFWRTSARRISISIDARMVDRSSGNVIWQDDSIVETATWDLGADPLSDREARRRAVRQLAERLAAKLYSRTVDRF